MTVSKPNCLIVLPGCKEGVSSHSFIQCFTLTNSAFSVQIATPNGKTPIFINQDDHSRRWLNEFRTKNFSVPLNLEIIDPKRYSCILIPHAPGASVDLANNKDLGQILNHFTKNKKLICAIGMGTCGLLPALEENEWVFKNYSMTGSSVYELAKLPDFADLAVVPEDSLREAGASYTTSSPESVHVVVDRHLVTGQNESSSLTSVQNLILLSNQRLGKSSGK